MNDIRNVGFALTVVFLSGCGAMLQGTHQVVRITSMPPGTKVEVRAPPIAAPRRMPSRRLSSHNMAEADPTPSPSPIAVVEGTGMTIVTPGEMRLRRKPTDGVLLRFTKEGYYSECRFLEWKTNRGLMTLDSIPAAIPLLMDLIAQTRPGRFLDVDVKMEGIPVGHKDLLLPSADILAAFRNGVNLCKLPPEVVTWMRLRSRFGDRTTTILATTGEPNRRYTILGEVGVRTKGINEWSWNYWSVYGYSHFRLRRNWQKELRTSINEMLKLRAMEAYGERVDAITNIQYEDLPNNDVSATGMAVRFQSPGEGAVDIQGGVQRSATERLVELRKLLDAGVISQGEFDQKRKEILDGL